MLEVERVLPLISPGYQCDADEQQMRAAWKVKRAALDAAFEEHLAKHGNFRRSA